MHQNSVPNLMNVNLREMSDGLPRGVSPRKEAAESPLRTGRASSKNRIFNDSWAVIERS
jgi:hypothetical protein